MGLVPTIHSLISSLEKKLPVTTFTFETNLDKRLNAAAKLIYTDNINNLIHNIMDVVVWCPSYVCSNQTQSDRAAHIVADHRRGKLMWRVVPKTCTTFCIRLHRNSSAMATQRAAR